MVLRFSGAFLCLSLDSEVISDYHFYPLVCDIIYFGLLSMIPYN